MSCVKNSILRLFIHQPGTLLGLKAALNSLLCIACIYQAWGSRSENHSITATFPHPSTSVLPNLGCSHALHHITHLWDQPTSVWQLKFQAEIWTRPLWCDLAVAVVQFCFIREMPKRYSRSETKPVPRIFSCTAYNNKSTSCPHILRYRVKSWEKSFSEL